MNLTTYILLVIVYLIPGLLTQHMTTWIEDRKPILDDDRIKSWWLLNIFLWPLYYLGESILFMTTGTWIHLQYSREYFIEMLN